MPWEMAPAWPVSPPPETLTKTSILSLSSTVWSGRTATREKFSWEKKESAGSPLISIEPVPSLRRTRAVAV